MVLFMQSITSMAQICRLHSSQAAFVGVHSQRSVSSGPCPLPLLASLCLNHVWEPRSWQEYCGIAFRLKSRQAFPRHGVCDGGCASGCASQANNNENSAVKMEKKWKALSGHVRERGAFTWDDGRTESALLHCPPCTYALCSNRTQGRVSGGDAVNVFWLPLREWGYSLYQRILKQQSGRPECCGCAWESDES